MKQMKRAVALLIAIIMLVVSFPTAITASSTNSDGYIEIWTVEDLNRIRQDLTANYILMNDLDLTEATAKGGDLDFMGNGWNPIGSGNVYGHDAFSGTFDGNGYAITGLRIDVTTAPADASGAYYVGLFANVTGTVKNLAVEGSVRCSVGKGCNAGGIAAYCSGTISNCVNNATIYGKNTHERYTSFVGGISGYCLGNITGCVNTGAVDAYVNWSIGTVYVGGIAGGGASTISKCHNSGSIGAYLPTVGCIAYIHGIAGDATISDCYNAGYLKINSDFGLYRLYGIGGKTVTRCYNAARVGKPAHNYAIGNGTNTDCYYLDGTGKKSTGAVALTQEQAKMPSMYAGFDFVNTWTIDLEADYPYPQLRNDGCYVSGTITSFGDSNDPVTIQLMQGDRLIASTVTANQTYKLSSVASGQYQLVISKENHVTRMYDITVSNANISQDATIHLRGDITGDGSVNLKDWGLMYDYFNEETELIGYTFQCADVNDNGMVNMKDWNLLYDHINEVEPLW